jgi:phosphoribosyl 1,2-cyclic phosphodiesterase
MVTISVLGSGSSGNCTYIGDDKSAILVDAGFSGKETLIRLEQAQLDINKISALFITHNHRDHISGAGVIGRKLNIPVYISRPNYNVSKRHLKKGLRLVFLKNSEQFISGNFTVTPFKTSHDSTDSSGFVINNGDKKIGFATDLGEVDEEIEKQFVDCDVILLESNHDEEMLINGPYPADLKERVGSSTGHISNYQAQALIKKVVSPKLAHLILLHLSDDNNSLEKAGEMKELLSDSGTKLTISLQTEPTDLIKIE